jgi:hypothetical protein
MGEILCNNIMVNWVYKQNNGKMVYKDYNHVSYPSDKLLSLAKFSPAMQTFWRRFIGTKNRAIKET